MSGPIRAQKNTQLSEAQQIQFDAAYINGTKEKLLGNYDEALNQFKACLYIDGTHSAVYYMLADVYYTKGSMQDAEDNIQKALKLDPRNIWYKKLEVEIYEIRKKYTKAAEGHLELSKVENKVGHLVDASYMYTLEKQYAKAIKMLELVEKEVGVNEDIIRQKEQIYLAMDNLKAAIKEIEKLIKAYPKQTKFLGMLADIYMVNGKPEKAIELYDRILKMESENGFAHFAYSDYYKAKGDKVKSYNHLKQGLASKDVDVKTKLEMIVGFIGDNTYEDHRKKCYELAETFIQANPTEAMSYLVLGDLYVQDDEYALGRQQYRKSIALEPKVLVAWQQAVFCSGQLRDNALLHKDCEEAIEYFPNEVLFYVYNAIACMQLKQYDKAVDNAQKGVELAEGNNDMLLQLYSNLGDAYHYLKNDSACDASYEKALSIDKNNPYALNNYAYFLSLRKHKLEKAEEMSKRSIDLEPGNASYLDTYGWIMFQQKRYDLAKEYIEKSLKIAPNSTEVIEHLGDVYFKLNQPEKALENWNKAKELGSDSETIEKKINEKKYVE